jgi:protein gp37
MMKVRHDLKFFIITKRSNRFFVSLPNDWEDRYDNVEIACTVENQEMANFRLPIFFKLPIKHQYIIVAPILENIILLPFWDKTIESVAVGGESGKCARVCDFNWILNIREQCVKADVPFLLHQTGSKFLKDNKIYSIPRNLHHLQAKKDNINFKIDD